jgi:rod shape-determining protein MreD
MMRRLGLLLACAVAAWIAHGTLATLLPAALAPDLTLVLTVAVAVTGPPLSGLFFAAGVGFGADLLSGALLGQHALLRILVFAAARALGAQFDLRRGLPLAIFVGVLSVADALGLLVLGSLFQETTLLGFDAVGVVLARSLWAALLAPVTVRALNALQEWLEEGDTRREVRLEPRRPVF